MSYLSTKRRRDFRASRRQFMAVYITIGLGILLFASSFDAYRNLEASYSTTYERLAFSDMTISGVDDSFTTTAEGIHGVSDAEYRRQADLPMRVNGEVFFGRIVGPAGSGSSEINRLDITDGSALDESDLTGSVIETHMATEFSVGTGDKVEVLGTAGWIESTALGVAISAEYIWPARNRQEIFPPPETFGVMFVDDSFLDQVPANTITEQVLTRYDSSATVSTVDEKLTEASTSAGAASAIPQAQQSSNEALQLDVQGFAQMSVAFPALFLLAAGMATFILMTRIVFSQRSVIGTLRASGVSRRRLERHYLSFGLTAAVVGIAIGLPLGMLAGWLATGAYTNALGIPDSTAEFHLLTPVIGIAFGLLTGLLAAWVPARSATRLSPADAMRGEVPAESGSRSLPERILPPLRNLPIRWKMVLRGIGRSPKRTISTALGVALAVIVVLVSWGMLDSIQVLLGDQFNEIELQDVNVAMAAEIDDTTVDQIASIEGVDAAEPMVSLTAAVKGPKGTYETQLTGLQTDTVMHGFPDGLPTGGIIAGEALSAETGVEVGDEITVELPTVGTSIQEKLVGFVSEPMGTFLYIDNTALSSALDAGDPGVDGSAVLQSPVNTTVAARFADGFDRDAIIADIKKTDSVVTVIDAKALEQLLDQSMSFFYVFVGIMLLFGGAMAFALIFNTISVNVAERSTEYANMRANGISMTTLARLVAGENMILTMIGIPFGLLGGFLLGSQFMKTYSSDQFQMTFSVRPSTLILCSLAMLVVAGLSLIPALRTIRRLSIAEVVRERSL